MTDEQWPSIEAHFDALHDLPAEGRTAGLAAIADEDVRREVESLLQHSDANDTQPIDTDATLGLEPATNATGAQQKRIGPWRIERRLGQGGQGAVFEAVRDDGTFHQRAAIKIVKWEIDTEEARDRFRRERQILAGLEHPYIARLLDGGETAEGTPYLVMEFVDGLPLIAATQGWTRRRKLELFLKIADAVAFSHRNLIVHRDLKPANIMVARDGAPKLLDFGIARLLDSNHQRTMTGTQALTPDYASPEQVRGETITTACDVYTLGVVLYQMLTDRKPYAIETGSASELDRVICRQPPVPPGLGDELDQILLMALRKEPERRYKGVQLFAEDILRYLDHRPVSARPDTLRYRATKFVRRNWWQIAAVTAVIVSLGAGLGFSLVEQRRANRRFNQVRQLAGRILFDFHDQLANTPGTVKLRESLVSTALQYLNSLAPEAGRDTGLRRELAVAFGRVAAAQGSITGPSLGRPRDAVASLQKALALARGNSGANSADAEDAAILTNLLCDASETYRFLREYDTALRLAKEAVAGSAALPAVARERALTETSATLNQMGDLLGSATALEQTLSIARDNADRDRSWEGRRQLATVLNSLGVARHRLTRFAEAELAMREALAIYREAAAQHPDDPRITRSVAQTLRLIGDVEGACDRPSLGRLKQATETYEAALAQTSTLIRADPNDLNSRNEAGLLQNKMACSLVEVDPATALRHAALSVQLIDTAVQIGTQFRAQPRISEANAYRALGQFAAAERMLKEAAQVLLPSDGNSQADMSLVWARLEAARGNREAAESWFARAIEEADRLFRKTTTPFYAWNVEQALELAARALPESAQSRREKIFEIWQGQNYRFPGQPYIMQQLSVRVRPAR